MLDIEVSPEVADAIAEIGRVDPRYHSPEGVLFRTALSMISDIRKWNQGMYCYDGRVCSLGAINKANTGNPYDVVVRYTDSPASRVRLALEDVMPRIARFNDTHTHAEVIAKWHEAGFANGWL